MLASAITFSFFSVALAQYGSGSGSSSVSSAVTPSSTSSASNGIQTILVGSPQTLVFSPNSVSAPVGTVVEFVFYPNTHSVAQSSFAQPCQPLANDTGFFSGPQATTSGTNPNVFTITVNDTKPIWYYCAFKGHCSAGMVGVINPPADGSKTIDQFVSAAAQVSSTVPPSKVQGGTVGPASAVKASTSSTGNAGVESRGPIQWGLFAVTGVFTMGFAAGFGGLMI